jgi:hypothetical protein
MKKHGTSVDLVKDSTDRVHGVGNHGCGNQADEQ